MSPTKNAVESLRDIVQDLLVPELKAIKVSVESGHTEVGYLRDETRSSFDSLRQEMRLRDEKMELLIRHGDEKNEQAIHTLGRTIDSSVEIRERLAAIEARLPRQ
jgi:hypothetical protein